MLVAVAARRSKVVVWREGGSCFSTSWKSRWLDEAKGLARSLVEVRRSPVLVLAGARHSLWSSCGQFRAKKTTQDVPGKCDEKPASASNLRANRVLFSVDSHVTLQALTNEDRRQVIPEKPAPQDVIDFVKTLRSARGGASWTIWMICEHPFLERSGCPSEVG